MRIRFRFRHRLGRTVAYNALPAAQAPTPNAGVLTRPLPTSGNASPNTAPASRRVVDGAAAAGRRQFVTIAADLETGPPPTRIRRATQAIDRGAVQGGTGVGVTGPLSFDPKTDGGSLMIPHIRIPRRPITVTAFRRTFDFKSTIPSRGIGAPVK